MNQNQNKPQSVDAREESPVASPCIGVCNMDKRSGLCEGCQRTLDEIAQWSSASDEWKRAVWEEIARRNGL